MVQASWTQNNPEAEIFDSKIETASGHGLLNVAERSAVRWQADMYPLAVSNCVLKKIAR
jgi:hypothetical protein